MPNDSRLKSLENTIIIKNEDRIELSYKTCEINFGGNTGVYVPDKTALDFHNDKTSTVKLAMGPYGSGKTSFLLMDGILKACAMPPCKDGVRRSRAIIIRNTFDQLKKGAFDLWMTWCSKLGKVDYTVGNQLYAHHLFDDGHGLVDYELWFLPVNSREDVEKLKSFNATFAIINELSTLPQLAFKDVSGRLGRYPKQDLFDPRYIKNPDKPYWYGILADTNPPKQKHFIYDIFEKEMPQGFRIFKQPPGLLEDENWNLVKDGYGQYVTNPEAENVGPNRGLAIDFYPKLAQGATREYINVYCMGRYGTLSSGKPVYPNYNDDFHAVDDIEIDKNEPILITLDGGFTPAALISQFVNGRLLFITEFTTERMYLEQLIEHVVKPWLAANCRDIPIMGWVGDPAITQREHEALDELGIDLEKATTNEITARVQAVVSFLTKMDKYSALSVSKRGCPVLREGFVGEYKFKELKTIEQKFVDTPEKSHPISDIHDCGQYAALHFISNMVNSRINTNSEIFINTEMY